MARRTKRKLRRSRRKKGGGNAAIPRIVFQTAAKPLDEKIIKKFKPYIQGWEYKFFTDEDALKFFKDNPLEDYPEIADRFNRCKRGENKADIFRIYFLYVKGGVYLDSDLILKENLDDIIGNRHFMTTYSSEIKDTIFNGFMASTPKHHILKEALTEAYNSEIETVEYFHFCAQLFKVVEKYKNEANVKILKEGVYDGKKADMLDPDTGKVLAIHYSGTDVPTNAKS